MKREVDMDKNISSSLINFERDFLSFQKQLPQLRETNPNQFVAFKEGRVIFSDTSVDKIKTKLDSVGIDASGAVVEFVSKYEIRMIV